MPLVIKYVVINFTSADAIVLTAFVFVHQLYYLMLDLPAFM